MGPERSSLQQLPLPSHPVSSLACGACPSVASCLSLVGTTAVLRGKKYIKQGSQGLGSSSDPSIHWLCGFGQLPNRSGLHSSFVKCSMAAALLTSQGCSESHVDGGAEGAARARRHWDALSVLHCWAAEGASAILSLCPAPRVHLLREIPAQLEGCVLSGPEWERVLRWSLFQVRCVPL